ncbi:TPA: hypothetical protein NIF81_006742, partial [Pseudomonas aeruginosa]|nr:hypothetical protein [Pseudomonas aeruginosa]
VSRFAGITHGALRTHLPLLTEIVNFLRCRFASLQRNEPSHDFMPFKLHPSTPF